MFYRLTDTVSTHSSCIGQNVSRKSLVISYFLTKTYVMSTQKKGLINTVLLSTTKYQHHTLWLNHKGDNPGMDPLSGDLSAFATGSVGIHCTDSGFMTGINKQIVN